MKRASPRRAHAVRHRRAGRAWVYAIALAIALVALAALQYRWTGEAARLERDRLARGTAAALLRFAGDFERELAALAFSFAGARTSDLGERWTRFASEASHPALLEEILVSLPRGRWLRFDRDTGALVPAAAPAGELEEALARTHGAHHFLAVDGVPTLVLPFGLHGHRGEATTGVSLPPGSLLFLQLSLAVLRAQVLPELAAESFRAFGLEHELWVVGDGDAVVWSSVPGSRVPPDAPRVALELAPGSPDLSRVHGRGMRRAHFLRRADAQGDPIGGFRRGGPPPWTGAPHAPDAAPFSLVAQHPAGSLDRAVAHLRARNLAVSFAVLAVLGASGALLWLAARRAEETARRQNEWVAGLTHELHTPLAALSAAGDNLADGVVRAPEKVREYGELIRREGRRLEKLVGQALALARLEGLQRAGQRAAEPVALAELVERTVAARELERRRLQATIEVDVPAHVPPVLGDADALGRVVGNLLDNALEHGGRRVWVRAERAPAARGAAQRVALLIADDGSGVPEHERDAIFEPYVRGAAARERGTPGAGLGLHLVRRLVEDMGGELSLLARGAPQAPSEACGAVFLLSLPAAPKDHEAAG